MCAGPWASVRAEHDGIPLGVHARRSLEPHLRAQAEHLLETTRACFDDYHRLFGIRYPFGEYHQVFVPEFNAGAMENPGCVTFRDTMVFRGAATPDQVLQRSNTIAHEMAHMWFGDLVTMTWWDDLWLNESFAEYMAYRTVCEVTEFTDAWVEFGVVRKLWGYAAERAPSTHPVAGSPAPDALSALGNFDGISYAKGASVIRQLIAHIGDEAFVAGVVEHLRAHEFGNGDLAQFLAAMESASGRSLTRWSAAWLETAGADRLALNDGLLTRTPPDAHPADRPHTLDVAAFAGGVEVARVEVVVEGERTPVPGFGSWPADALVVPNAGDLTWAEVALDPRTVAALPTRLPDVPDAQARAVLWVALLGAVSRAEVDPRAAVDVFAAAWPRETSAAVLSRTALVMTGRVVPMFLPPSEQEPALARVAAAADVLLTRSVAVGGADGDALAVVAARVWAGAAPTRSGCVAGRPATASPPCCRGTTTSGGGFCGGWRPSMRWARTRSRRPRPPTAPSPGRSPRWACGPCDRPRRPSNGRGPGCATTPSCRTMRRSRWRRASGPPPTRTSCGPGWTRWATSSWGCRHGWVMTPSRGSSPPSTRPGSSTTRPPRPRPRCSRAATSLPASVARWWMPTTSCARPSPVAVASTGPDRDRGPRPRRRRPPPPAAAA